MIIAHSPTRQPSMEQPNRIVLRDLGNEYVVHTQLFTQDGKTPYALHCGNYYPKKPHEHEALHAAWKRFEERSRRLLAIEPDVATEGLLTEYVRLRTARVIRDADACTSYEEEIGELLRIIAERIPADRVAAAVKEMAESAAEQARQADDEKKNRARFEGSRREALGSDPGDDPDYAGY